MSLIQLADQDHCWNNLVVIIVIIISYSKSSTKRVSLTSIVITGPLIWFHSDSVCILIFFFKWQKINHAQFTETVQAEWKNPFASAFINETFN